MFIVSVKSSDSEELRKIELSDGSIFSFKTCYLSPAFIDERLYTPGAAEGCKISATEEEGFRFAAGCLQAEKAALQLVARAEQNVFGLIRKLEKRRHDPACVRAVIGRLCELDLLDDHRYARLWLETRISRQSSSPWRLLAALRSRGIDRNDAESAVKEALDDDTEFQLLQRYVEKIKRKQAVKSGAQESAAEAQRSLKYQLRNEGFSTSAIQRFFEE